MTIFATHDTYVFDDRNITKISEIILKLNSNFQIIKEIFNNEEQEVIILFNS